MRIIRAAGMNVESRVEINRLYNFDSLLISRPRSGRRMSTARSQDVAEDFSDVESVSSVASFAPSPGQTERLVSILKKVGDKPFTMTGRKRINRAKSLPPLPTEISEPASLTSDGNPDQPVQHVQQDDENKENEHNAGENTPQNDLKTESNKQDWFQPNYEHHSYSTAFDWFFFKYFKAKWHFFFLNKIIQD